MKLAMAARLLMQNVRRGKRSFVLSVFGITVGISSLCFFLALSQGVRERVFSRVFPPGRLEVVPARSTLDAGPLGDLLGPRPLTDEAIRALASHPDVQAVYPRMKAAFPIRGWGGERILGRPIYAELIIDGIDDKAVIESTAPLPFKDLQGKDGAFCTEDANCKAPSYCEWDRNRCELPVPVIVSPMLLELYNGSIAKSRNLPRIGSFLASQFRGLSITAELGRSFVARDIKDGTARQRRLMLVGVSSRAMPIGLTVPLAYVRRWNTEYGGKRASQEYSSLSVEVRGGRGVTAVVDAVRKLGYTIEDNGAEQAGLAVTLLTAVFLLISLAIIVLATVNIAHTFFRAVSERRRELGVMRAVGASAADVRLLLMAEGGAVGLCGGVIGLGAALLASLLIDLVSRRYLPDFPFKPDSFFVFSPALYAGAPLLSILTCVAGAYLPARAAAKLSPAAALTAI